MVNVDSNNEKIVLQTLLWNDKGPIQNALGCEKGFVVHIQKKI
jgi:hypothetical protein